jgi:hypothetical protein
VQERNLRRPARAEDGEEGGRRESERPRAGRPLAAGRVARRGPENELRAEHEARLSVEEDEGPVRQLAERGLAAELAARRRVDALGVQARVDRIGAGLAGMKLPPELGEADVVLAPAESARAVPGGERRRLVEEEELREAARLQERTAPPAAEAEAARDPPLARVAPADPPGLVVETAAVAVDEAARRVGDELSERRRAVPERHGPSRTSTA